MEFYLSFQELLGRGGNSLALIFLPLFLVMTVPVGRILPGPLACGTLPRGTAAQVTRNIHRYRARSLPNHYVTKRRKSKSPNP